MLSDGTTCAMILLVAAAVVVVAMMCQGDRHGRASHAVSPPSGADHRMHQSVAQKQKEVSDAKPQTHTHTELHNAQNAINTDVGFETNDKHAYSSAARMLSKSQGFDVIANIVDPLKCGKKAGEVIYSNPVQTRIGDIAEPVEVLVA